MRKSIIGILAIAMLAIPSVASADVPRCEAPVPVETTVTTATFTALQPKDTTHQFTNVWQHDFTVTVNLDEGLPMHVRAIAVEVEPAAFGRKVVRAKIEFPS